MGSDNSWADACLSNFAITRQPVSYQVDNMLGSVQSEVREAWKMNFVLPDNTIKQATLLKSSHFRHSLVSKIQMQLISCPTIFATRHKLEEKLYPITRYNKEQVIQTGDCQALILLGKDLLYAHPKAVDHFEASVGHDNIQNLVCLLENQLYPELLLVGQRLEIPVGMSQELRLSYPSKFGEKYSPREEGHAQPPRGPR